VAIVASPFGTRKLSELTPRGTLRPAGVEGCQTGFFITPQVSANSDAHVSRNRGISNIAKKKI
jgi:hypothetical protein